MAEKVKVLTPEWIRTILAVGFIVVTGIVLYYASIGVLSPLTVGLLVTIMAVYSFVIFKLYEMAKLTFSGLVMLMTLGVGLLLMIFGAIQRGILPLFYVGTTQESELFTTLFYGLIVFGLIAFVVYYLHATSRLKIPR